VRGEGLHQRKGGEGVGRGGRGVEIDERSWGGGEEGGGQRKKKKKRKKEGKKGYLTDNCYVNENRGLWGNLSGLCVQGGRHGEGSFK